MLLWHQRADQWMRRIAKTYENRFQALLGRVKARRMQKAAQWLRHRAEQLSVHEGIPLLRAWTEVYERARQRLEARRPGHMEAQLPSASVPPRFLCDAGLGGLARWLRAAGYEAKWIADSTDDALLQEVQRLGAILLTTDSLLLERRLLRDGLIRALWLSPSFKTIEQLQTVLGELKLPLRPPRCMKCGGRLVPTEKESLRERIPPKTYRWRDEYFVCDECGQLFWHGTHWEKIQAQLKKAAESRTSLGLKIKS